METDENIIVEVLDSTQIPLSELSEFTETKPIKIEEFKQESQEILIKKYVSGEVSFPTYYTTLEADDDEENNDDDNDDRKNFIQDTISEQQFQSIPGSSISLNIDNDSGQKKDKRQSNILGGNSGGRRRSILNPALQGLMGEANLRFARGQNDMTEKICLEIIRQNPLAPEPFFTLAQIYETKDVEKFLNFLTIAAHLDPGNRDQWVRIAEMNIEKKNYHQARVLYSKAIKHLPKDYDIRLKKAKLLEIMGEHRDAMFTYLKMIPIVPIEKGELCLVTAKNVAKYFYEQNKIPFALEAMRSAYAIVSKLFTYENINLYLELLMINKNYDIVLTILRDHCNVDLEIEQDGNEMIIIACQIPDNLIIDFRVKLCVSLIHCKAYDLINYIINNIIEKIAINDGIDCYMDIVEALMKEEKYNEALKLTEPILSNHISPPAYVWLKNGECYRAIDLIDNAIESYYKVIELAPLFYEAKFTLSALLKQKGRHREAIKALEQDMDGDSINPRLLYECCLMLKTINEIDQYIDIGYLLLARKSLKFRSREEMIACSNGGNSFNAETYKSIVETRFDKDIEDEPEYNETEANLSIEDEYELFKNIAETTYCLKKFGILQKLCFAMATSKRFRGKYREMEKIIMMASLYNDDPLIAFYFFREILAKNIDNNAYWNFMNVIIQSGDETRYHRFLKRIFEKHSCPSYLKILLANYHLIAGSYKYALNFYVPIFKESFDPLACLCIGICFTQISLQKNSLKKPTGIAQAIAFCRKYSELRMSSSTKQEIYYNLGRMHHQSGVIHLALHYYEQALEVNDEIVNENINILGLKEEIAFNIHLIYKVCGNLEMARKYLYKYIIV